MEHFRTTNDNTNTTFQWIDSDLFMVLDRVTGKPERIAHNDSIGTLQEARLYVESRKGWEDRMIIVRLNAISAYRV